VSTSQSHSGKPTTFTTRAVEAAKPDHAPGITVPYKGPCENPDVRVSTGIVNKWPPTSSFEGLQHLTTMAMGLSSNGSVLYVWAGTTNEDPSRGLIMTNLEPGNFCVSTTFGPMNEAVDATPRGAIELIGLVNGDTIHYVYLDNQGQEVPGQHSYSLTSKTFS
jgi:hypothetical protein